MNSEEQLKQNIFEHCLGKGNPTIELVERGSFPPNWVSHYVSLVEKATNVWGSRGDWPKELVASLHFASFYLEIRFDAWRKASGRDNPSTRQGLGEIRRCSEMFLLSPLKNEKSVV
jgi:hypothetical protein